MRTIVRKGAGIDRRLSIELLGNPDGFLTPIVERILLSLSRSSSRNSRIVEKVDSGAYLLEEVYDTKLIDRIREDLQGHLESDKSIVTEVEGFETRYAINSDVFDFSKIEGFEELKEESSVNRTLKSYFGMEPDYRHPAVLQYVHLPSGIEGASTRRWHIDYGCGLNEVRLLIFLEDESNPLQVVPYDQTRDLVKRFGLDRVMEEPSLVSENSEMQSIGGSKGDAVLFDARRQLHRGTNPDRGDRRTVISLDAAPRLFRPG